MKPRLLDLFCGAGGCTKGYQRAGFYVVGVDNKPQPHYCGDEFIQADALTLDLDFMRSFDAIHASPPCQAYSVMQNIRKNVCEHPDLLEPTRRALIQSGRPYVIENVYKAPLRARIMLCGSMFGLKIIRHRYFESPCLDFTLVPSCDHRGAYDPWHNKGKRSSDKFRVAMGIDWMPDAGGGRRTGTVSQAIPPAYTEFIGQQLMRHIAESITS